MKPLCCIKGMLCIIFNKNSHVLNKIYTSFYWPRLALGRSGKLILLVFCFMCVVVWQQVFTQTSVPTSIYQKSMVLSIGDNIPEEPWGRYFPVVSPSVGVYDISRFSKSTKPIII